MSALVACSNEPEAPNAGDSNSGAKKGAPPSAGGPPGAGASGFRTTTNVEVVAAARGAVASYQVANGTVEARRRAPVHARIGELCVEVLVDENDQVTEGQVLARLQSARLKFAVDRMSANLDKAAQREYEAKLESEKAVGDHQRLLRIVEEGLEGQFIAADDIARAQLAAQKAVVAYEAAKADHMSAKSDLGNAQLDLSHTEIKAPISGIVAQRKVEPFDLISPDQELFVVAELDSLRLRLDLPETAAPLMQNPPRLADGNVNLEQTQAVLLASTAYPQERFLGFLELVSPVITDPERGMLGVIIRVVQPENVTETDHGPLLRQFPPAERSRLLETARKAQADDGLGMSVLRLRPGNFLEASIVTRYKSDALVIPTGALVAGGAFVINEPPSAPEATESASAPTVSTGTDNPAAEAPAPGSGKGGKRGQANANGPTPSATLTVRRVELGQHLGISSEGYSEVLPGSPLREGDRIVFRGQEYLRDGGQVRILEAPSR